MPRRNGQTPVKGHGQSSQKPQSSKNVRSDKAILKSLGLKGK